MPSIRISPGSEVDNVGDELLRVEGLTTQFFTDEGQVNAVSGVDLALEDGEVYGLVGESGSGKSVTALSIVDLVDSPGRVTDGSIWLRDEKIADAFRGSHPSAVEGDMLNLTVIPEAERRALRGSTFSMIFQDPESSFNPTLTVGEQIAEAVEVQRRIEAASDEGLVGVDYSLRSYLLSFLVDSRKFVKQPSRDRAIELLELVGIPDPIQRAEEYPHEYSGGMLQRAMIAQALASEPDILIADEPTTALDVTIQAQVLDLLADLRDRTGLTILLITHNLGVIARMCDRVGVMYAGEIVERGTLADVFDRASHPYTQGLLGSIPDLDEPSGRLQPIPGNVPSLLDDEMEDRCYFADRCPRAMEACLEKPAYYDVEGSTEHRMTCHLAHMEYGESPPLADGDVNSDPITTEPEVDS